MRNAQRTSIVRDAESSLQLLSRADKEVTVDDSIYDEDVLTESRTKQVAAEYIWLVKLTNGKVYRIRQAGDSAMLKALASLDPDRALGEVVGTLTGIYLDPERLKYGPRDIRREEFNAIQRIALEL